MLSSLPVLLNIGIVYCLVLNLGVKFSGYAPAPARLDDKNLFIIVGGTVLLLLLQVAAVIAAAEAAAVCLYQFLLRTFIS